MATVETRAATGSASRRTRLRHAMALGVGLVVVAVAACSSATTTGSASKISTQPWSPWSKCPAAAQYRQLPVRSPVQRNGTTSELVPSGVTGALECGYSVTHGRATGKLRHSNRLSADAAATLGRGLDGTPLIDTSQPFSCPGYLNGFVEILMTYGNDPDVLLRYTNGHCHWASNGLATTQPTLDIQQALANLVR